MSWLDSGLGNVTERKGARRGRLAISFAEGIDGAVIVFGIIVGVVVFFVGETPSSAITWQ